MVLPRSTNDVAVVGLGTEPFVRQRQRQREMERARPRYFGLNLFLTFLTSEDRIH